MKRMGILSMATFIALACLLTAGHAQINFSIKIIPPEPFAERPPQPSNNHVWVEDEWVRQNNNYVRKPGYWVVPERDQIWVKGEWIQNSDGSSYWQPGYWKPIPHMGVPNWIPEPNYLRPPRPSARDLWVNGEWIWLNNRYMYQTGFWTVPAPNKMFVKGHWAQWPNGEWYWVIGYWKKIPDNVYVSVMPPEPAIPRPPAPSPQHTWIEGEWTWENNSFTYQPGFWMVRDPHKERVRGYWHQRQDGNFIWIKGYWDWV